MLCLHIMRTGSISNSFLLLLLLLLLLDRHAAVPQGTRQA
jgi:hypothetical protein